MLTNTACTASYTPKRFQDVISMWCKVVGLALDLFLADPLRFCQTRVTFSVFISFEQAILLTMVLVGVQNEPQGPAYLPPSSRPAGGGGTGHPDEWAGVSICIRVLEERGIFCVVICFSCVCVCKLQ